MASRRSLFVSRPFLLRIEDDIRIRFFAIEVYGLMGDKERPLSVPNRILETLQGACPFFDKSLVDSPGGRKPGEEVDPFLIQFPYILLLRRILHR
jgi:hypothetical protein